MIVHTIQLQVAKDKIVLWNDVDGFQAISGDGYETRQDAVLRLLAEAEKDYAGGAFGPILIHTNDQPISTVEDHWRCYSFCIAAGYQDVPVPDFVFDSWPEVGIDDYDETCRMVAAAGARPAQLGVVGWIGTRHSHPVRSRLLELSREHPDLLDAQEVEWVRVPSQRRLETSTGKALSLPEQTARWNALIDVEGGAYSGRLKLLFHSGRPVLVQERPWREWFWDALMPMENYVPVRRDLSDLVEKARWVQDNAEEAAEIGRAGQAMAQRLLTRASAVEQWRQTLSVAAEAPQEVWAFPAFEEAVNPVLRRLGVHAGSPS